MNLTITEAIAILTKHLGVDVRIVDQQTNDDDWTINTQTTHKFPVTLNSDDEIIVVMSDGITATAVADHWSYSWDIDNDYHITKYRKVK